MPQHCMKPSVVNALLTYVKQCTQEKIKQLLTELLNNRHGEAQNLDHALVMQVRLICKAITCKSMMPAQKQSGTQRSSERTVKNMAPVLKQPKVAKTTFMSRKTWFLKQSSL